MAKSKTSYVCQSCGAVSSRWAGKCESCGEWNTITQDETAAAIPKGMNGSKKGRLIDFVSLNDPDRTEYQRHKSDIEEIGRASCRERV